MTGKAEANYWQASVDGEIVGRGSTPTEALAAAKERFPERAPTLVYQEAAGQRPLPLSPVLDALRTLLDKQTMPVYVVGGVVRDALLQQTGHDIDLTVPHDAIALAFQIGDDLKAPAYVLDRERDVGRVMLSKWQTTVDVARFRGPSLEEDLYGRDFTINAMALPGTARDAGSIIDPLHGIDDLRDGRIRIVHANSINDDPIRALRAVRQSLLFGFEMTDDTVAAVREGALGLQRVSPERIRDELVRLIESDHPDQAVMQMVELGLLAVILPEVAALAGVEQSPPHHEPVLEHTISVLRWLRLVEDSLRDDQPTEDSTLTTLADLLRPYREEIVAHLEEPVEGGISGHTLLRLGGLFHDVGKRETQSTDPDGRIRFLGHDAVGAQLAAQRMKVLTFSNEAIERVAGITDGHMRPLHLAAGKDLPTRRAIYRFFRATRSAGIDIVLLSLADHLATHDGPGDDQSWQDLLAVSDALLATYFTAYVDVVQPVRLLTGGELIRELNLQPGPEIGRLLFEIEEAQAAGQVITREQALSLARQLHADKQ